MYLDYLGKNPPKKWNINLKCQSKTFIINTYDNKIPELGRFLANEQVNLYVVYKNVNQGCKQGHA